MGRESACDLFYRLPCVLAMESERHSVSLRDRRLGVRSYTHALFAQSPAQSEQWCLLNPTDAHRSAPAL
jgi:hypothetical protein